jgi:hypothetical protein
MMMAQKRVMTSEEIMYSCAYILKIKTFVFAESEKSRYTSWVLPCRSGSKGRVQEK